MQILIHCRTDPWCVQVHRLDPTLETKFICRNSGPINDGLRLQPKHQRSNSRNRLPSISRRCKRSRNTFVRLRLSKVHSIKSRRTSKSLSRPYSLYPATYRLHSLTAFCWPQDQRLELDLDLWRWNDIGFLQSLFYRIYAHCCIHSAIFLDSIIFSQNDRHRNHTHSAALLLYDHDCLTKKYRLSQIPQYSQVHCLWRLLRLRTLLRWYFRRSRSHGIIFSPQKLLICWPDEVLYSQR